ncbi:hypothetical protein AVEN_7340-1 [Araneus ventricosus]|uniref:Uncharacterized protein n=1 Tax=Araneus ventricosus TaxID=182803 RepID=A0A4Y2BT78_ARAVE|nr:hypothetical protein AVEN_7340-1 [Araneus ventricosus]
MESKTRLDNRKHNPFVHYTIDFCSLNCGEAGHSRPLQATKVLPLPVKPSVNVSLVYTASLPLSPRTRSLSQTSDLLIPYGISTFMDYLRPFLKLGIHEKASYAICRKTGFLPRSRKIRQSIHGCSKVCFETKFKVAEFLSPRLFFSHAGDFEFHF